MSIGDVAAQEIAITLPDGSVRTFQGPVTGTDIAAGIAKSLAKKAIAIEVDGEVRDLSRPIAADAKVRLLTREDVEALELIRHDAAHVMAEAVQELFPGTQVTIGPAIEHGFYYDFAKNEPFTAEDLPAIEEKMREIVSRGQPFTREEWDRDAAIRFFEERGERYKAELIRDLPESETISIYRQGEWLDLCRGPHMPTTGHVGGAFKLTHVAGAYWRGDHRNAMLSRIYGTAWRTKEELDAHLTMLEEAAKRDHRRLGREMGLFHLQEEATGSIFWHPKGWTLYRACERYVRARLEAADYQEVKTPQLIDRALWEKSGHWDKFREAMFIAEVDEGDKTSEGNPAKKMLALKPMNCPGHVQIFKQGIKSYRDLPLRMAEFGSCHRYEPSGALHGIMRVRGFTQDDAHIFCTEAQIADETKKFIDLLSGIYRDFGYDNFRIKFSDRPETRSGSDEIWDRAEAALKEASEKAGVEMELNPGEGAFYGPKLEFVLRDAIGRDWQCGTLQADFVLPERLDATYVGEDGNKHRPVMLHRAILGSMERFIGILLENTAGHLPLWLAPVQAVVATITEAADDYATEVQAILRKAGLRTELDLRNEKINYKVREHSHAKVPVLLVVGRKEAEERTVSIRRLGSRAQETLALDAALDMLTDEATSPAERDRAA